MIIDMLKVAGGSWKVPFEFTIADYAIESYEGEYAKIIYKIKVKSLENRQKQNET